MSARWYDGNTNSDPPFHLAKKFSFDKDKTSCSSVAIFPWSEASLKTLWNGNLDKKDHRSDWTSMIKTWSGACAVGTPNRITVYGIWPSSRPIYADLPVAWVIKNEKPFNPLVVFTASSLMYVLDVKKQKIVGNVRGHGGPITSIAVHPTQPHYFCTNSRDFTTRIYDLLLEPTQTPNNPCWPPSTTPSLAGAAHGLHTTEKEGDGYSRCVAVLAGGRSGGHQAAVLAAAFHPTFPLIATCGVDRTVKIWKLPRLDEDMLAREDKPLFSSTQIHKARVLSVHWVSEDILMTHSAPALMRRRHDVPDDLYEEDGTLVLWRWLGRERFFPPNEPHQRILRGCATDYQESASFKIISAYSLPSQTNYLSVYESHTHDPIVMFPSGDRIVMLNAAHFKPRFASAPPPFPLDQNDLVDAMNRARLEDDVDEDGDQNPPIIQHPPPPIIHKEWEIQTDSDEEKLVACTMGVGGGIIAAVGDKGSLWVWLGNMSSAL